MIFLYRLFKPTTTQRRSRLQHWYCVGVNTSKRYRPKVPTYTWRLEWNSKLRPSGSKALNLPLSYHAPSTAEEHNA